MTGKPYLSICIPTYNRIEYLKKCLRSVIPQITNEVEVLVRDNCSNDGTEPYMKSFSHPLINYSRNYSNIGLVNNFIEIVKSASGEFVYMLTDDDYLLTDGIANSIAFARKANCLAFKTAYFQHNELSRSGAYVSLFSADITATEVDIEKAAIIYHESNILTGFVFNRSIFDEPMQRSHSANWYPSLLLAGCAGQKLGYLSEPTNVHIWQNETYWGISPEKREELNRGQIEILLFLVNKSLISRTHYVALVKRHLTKWTYEDNSKLLEPLDADERKVVMQHFSLVKRQNRILKIKAAIKRLVP
jgi:glycosyltransferase involved in cell wall biosynthesis